MNIRELRIGNYLTGKSQQRRVYGMDKWGMIDFDAVRVKPRGAHVSECEGIPLTSEWPQSFGFKKNGPIEFWNLEIATMDFQWDKVDGLMIVVGDNGVIQEHIKHVHQLQNLYFALTGSELELTPEQK